MKHAGLITRGVQKIRSVGSVNGEPVVSVRGNAMRYDAVLRVRTFARPS